MINVSLNYWSKKMYNQSVNHQDDSFSVSVRVFLLGMAVAFLISLGISYSTSVNLNAGSSVVNCDDPVSLSRAQDQSRNGIANACL